MKLSIGFSTCPNDTFMFDAMVHHKIDTEGLEFEILMGDVEELNKGAFANRLDVTKLSYHAYAYVADNYLLLNSGSALGDKNGPLLISKEQVSLDKVDDLSIAIPGKFTTANLLLSIAFPKAARKVSYVFSEIESAVINESVEAGLIIHESRFTYEQKGLKKIIDLGEYWEKETAMPLPLGGIVVNRRLPKEVQLKVDRVLQRSIDSAFFDPLSSMSYVTEHAQEMDQEVMFKHIELYVNEYSRDLGEKGRAAVYKLFELAVDRGVVEPFTKEIFLSK